jgi:hypothetical protein
MVDPRAAVGDFIWSWIVYGYKGVRYLVSADYRRRVHAFWRLPGTACGWHSTNDPGRDAGCVHCCVSGRISQLTLDIKSRAL